jgi:2-polyprenyl-3-methyl-5-hydroxy-6-metoxy-1,4-benzoquinol methylase
MKQSTLEKLRSPGQGEKLELVSGDFNNGELKANGRKFPIIDGIPRLLHENFDRYTSQSFSTEWKELKTDDDVWGRPIDERMGELELLEIPLEQLRGKEFLDVGCGNGLFARAVATRYGAYVTAVDISRGLETAKRISAPQETIDFIQADVQYPPFAPESFDIIWGAGSIHHTPNPRQTFKALIPLLKKGGRIFVWLYAPRTR